MSLLTPLDREDLDRMARHQAPHLPCPQCNEDIFAWGAGRVVAHLDPNEPNRLIHPIHSRCFFERHALGPNASNVTLGRCVDCQLPVDIEDLVPASTKVIKRLTKAFKCIPASIVFPIGVFADKVLDPMGELKLVSLFERHR